MKYCSHCGNELMDEAVFCPKCGCAVDGGPADVPAPRKKDDTLQIVVEIFMILGCVTLGWCLIPLAWCIPMTVSAFRHFKSGEPLSTGFKVCTLLFVNLVAGILLLVMDDGN